MKKKNKVFYEEEIYPSEFRVRRQKMCEWIHAPSMLPCLMTMPCLLIGWVQDERHVAFHYESLQ